MIVDDSFNYHSLSLTIMFAIKRSMIVHDSLSVEIAQCASVASEDLFRYRSNSFPDIKVQSSIISSYIPIVVVIAKKCIIGLHIKLPLHFSLPGFLDFFAFLTFALFSVTVVRIFVQIIALLFFTGRWQCGSHIALSPPWLAPLTEKLSCTIIRSAKRTKLS